MRQARPVSIVNYMNKKPYPYMRYHLTACFALLLFYIAALPAQDSTQELSIRIRQTLFPEDFTEKELRVYQIERGSVEILIEGFDDTEAEVSVQQPLTAESQRRLTRTIEDQRIMSSYIDCRVFEQSKEIRLKTELMITYKGQTKVCYSFDKSFSGPLRDLIAAINQMLPKEEYYVEMPERNAKLGDWEH